VIRTRLGEAIIKRAIRRKKIGNRGKEELEDCRRCGYIYRAVKS